MRAPRVGTCPLDDDPRRRTALRPAPATFSHLDRADIGARFEQMCGEAVPQGMDGDLVNMRLLSISAIVNRTTSDTQSPPV
jgi:hypothetical protein